jgi:hypothetical protein
VVEVVTVGGLGDAHGNLTLSDKGAVGGLEDLDDCGNTLSACRIYLSFVGSGLRGMNPEDLFDMLRGLGCCSGIRLTGSQSDNRP